MIRTPLSCALGARVAPFLLAVGVLTAGCVPDPGRAERVDAEYLRIVAAEDARPDGGRELRTLVDATDHDLAFIRHAAVRALGRLERPDLVEHIVPLLEDPAPQVRSSAANALAQAFHTSEDAGAAAAELLARLDTESDAGVRGTIARSLGRLALDADLRREIATTLVDLSRIGGRDAPPETLLGVALGLESLVRTHPDENVSVRVAERLEELAAYPTGLAGDPVPGRIRGLALNALGISGRLTFTTIAAALRDPEPQPATVAARHVDNVAPSQRAELLRRIVGNPLFNVVVEGMLHLQRAPLDADACRYLMAGARSLADDAIRVAVPVGVLAVDGLDRPCPDLAAQREVLATVASGLDAEAMPWQAASRALVSLAAVAPERADEQLGPHARHANPFVRAYAAAAATILGDRGTLRAFADDPDPNVRTAAVTGLFGLDAHAIDALLIEQLRSDDPQLLLTVAQLLQGTPVPSAAADAALDAFVRVSAAERETWRDPRRALLRLLAETGRPELAPSLEPYLEDYDPLVASDVADLLVAWTGRARPARPDSLPRAALPTPAELAAMDDAVVRLHMEGGGTIDIGLDPYVAPTTAHRFYRLAREGYFDGLTFHRWAPNFVLQGGSPAANEYQGAAAYSRDEVGLTSHWRGTVGISTRGHDTGDAQIFINLLDNTRLDHTYTVIGRVVAGMRVVDLTMDGAVIERARVMWPS